MEQSSSWQTYSRSTSSRTMKIIIVRKITVYIGHSFKSMSQGLLSTLFPNNDSHQACLVSSGGTQ